MSNPVLLQTIGDGVCVLTMNRPEALNAWNLELRVQLKEMIASIRDDARVRCVVITGAGRAFSAGGDVKEMAPGRTPFAARTRLRGFLDDVIRPLVELQKPVIAAVNGAAIGAGLSLALAADVLVASESAYFSTPFVKLGLVPDAACAYLLVRAVGRQRAKKMLFDGARLTASQALQLGIVSTLTTDSELMEVAMSLARQYAALPPTALALTKAMVDRASTSSLQDMNEYEALCMGLAISDEDHAEALLAFKEKRSPTFAHQRLDIRN